MCYTLLHNPDLCQYSAAQLTATREKQKDKRGIRAASTTLPTNVSVLNKPEPGGALDLLEVRGEQNERLVEVVVGKVDFEPQEQCMNTGGSLSDDLLTELM